MTEDDLVCEEVEPSMSDDSPASSVNASRAKKRPRPEAFSFAEKGHEKAEMQDLQNEELSFRWRAETLSTFFSGGRSASTRSQLARIQVRNDGSAEDELTFRLMLWPVLHESGPSTKQLQGSTSAAASSYRHRLVLRLVGGRTASQAYGLAFHTTDSRLKIAIRIVDHRIAPIVESDTVLESAHPFMRVLKEQNCVAMRVWIKPSASGELPIDCTCC